MRLVLAAFLLTGGVWNETYGTPSFITYHDRKKRMFDLTGEQILLVILLVVLVLAVAMLAVRFFLDYQARKLTISKLQSLNDELRKHSRLHELMRYSSANTEERIAKKEQHDWESCGCDSYDCDNPHRVYEEIRKTEKQEDAICKMWAWNNSPREVAEQSYERGWDRTKIAAVMSRNGFNDDAINSVLFEYDNHVIEN